MKIIMQCNACGFVINKNKIKEMCPACGLPRKVFKELKDEITPQRRFVLELDLHPFAVHFTQAIGVGFLLLIVSMTVLDNSVKTDFLIISKWLCYFLPFSTLFTVVLGFFDAKIRFKRVLTPFLKLKIGLSIVLFIISCTNFILAYFFEIEVKIYYFLGLSLVIVGLEAILGLIGAKLIHTALKG